jgi:hypothetical protein
MKNVTITMEEDVARWAKVEAAKLDTSVSRMLGEILKKQMVADQQIQQAQDRFFSRSPRPLKPRDEAYPDRGSLYDR